MRYNFKWNTLAKLKLPKIISIDRCQPYLTENSFLMNVISILNPKLVKKNWQKSTQVFGHKSLKVVLVSVVLMNYYWLASVCRPMN